GNGARPHEPLQDRQFVRIDRDNFNYVMSRIDPSLSVTIENTLTRDGSKLPVQLSFKSMEDFEPGRIVQQVQVLSKLLETRDKLVDLLSKIERSDELNALLTDIVQNPAKLGQLSREAESSGSTTGEGHA